MYRDMFNADWGKFSDDSFIGELKNGLTSIAEWEVSLCSSDLDVNTDMSGNYALIDTGKGVYKNAVRLNARRTAKIVPPEPEKPYYDYWIEGGITGIKKDSDLNFKVVLVDSSGTSEDYTKKITGEESAKVTKNNQVKFGGFGTSYAFSSEKQFTKVCIVFQTNTISDYFDSVSFDGNKFCQIIVAEE